VQADNNTFNTAVRIRIIADTSAVVASGTIWTYLVQGEITANQPQQGQVGTVIDVSGTNLLGGGSMVSEIFLDGVSGTITTNSSSRVTVSMDDLLTQRVGFFPGEIYIMSDTGAIVSGGNYTHRASGSITSFSPTRGRQGTIITIQGSNVMGFGANISGIEIAGIPGTLSFFDNSMVIATAGMGPQNQTGPIVLQINTGATITSSVNFTFDEPGIASSVTPMQGAEGTGVSVSGSGLIPDNVNLTSITVGGVPVSRVVTSSNQEVSIIVGPAPLNGSNRSMILMNFTDGSFVGGVFFSFMNFEISLNGLSQGQVGTVIEINLPDSPEFTPSLNLRVTVDALLASIITINETERRLVISVPRARQLGTFTADVAVEGANGVIARLRDGFTYLAEGLICSVDPVVGQTGTIITVTGDNLLGGGSSIESASVVGQPARVVHFNDTIGTLQLMPITASSFPLQGDIVLTADTGAVVQRLNTFTLAEPGNITQVSPSMGQNGTTVNITGTNLLQGGLNISSVSLAGVAAAVLDTPMDTLISVQANSSPMTQPLSVVITLSSGAIISSDGMSFQYLSPGTITSVVPNSGAVGTRVTINGINLLQGGSRVNMVLLGGVSAMIDSTPSNSSIIVVAQAGVPGSGDVAVISNTGSTITAGNIGWTYEALGTISNVFPAIGQQGMEATITGESLLGLSASQFSSCSLAGIPATIIPGQFNTTSVRCRAGAINSSRMDISGPVELVSDIGVTLNSGPNVTFTYYAAYIDDIMPKNGNNGTEVTIGGLNLFNSPNGSFQLTRVLFGSVMAESVSSSNTEIIVRVGFYNMSGTNQEVRIESSAGSFVVLTNAWNYTSPRTIHSLEPQNGFPGETVTLYGENLIPDGVSTARVIVGQTEAFNVQLVNASIIEFQVGIYENSDPPETDLPVQIVYPSGETTFNSMVLFSYDVTPETVTSISPVAGGEGDVVVISGTNLPNSTNIQRITLANIAAVLVNATTTEITVQAGAPPTAGVRGQVSIEIIDGGVLGLAGDEWEYYPVLTSSNVSPTTGQNGTIVTIDLSPISNLPTVMGVSLTDVPATDVSTENGTLIVRAGESAATRNGSITVSLAGSITITILNAWSYQAPVRVTDISPSSGYFNTLVTINGSGFRAGSGDVNVTDVYLAGVETNIEFQSDTMLRVRVSQENPSGSDLVGRLTINTNTGSSYSLEQGLNFTHVGVRITNVTPQRGTRGTLVTLTGVELLAGGTNITSVTLAGVPATVQNSNSTSVSFRAGALSGSSNLSSIEYMMDTGAIVTAPDSWRYIEPGVITSVTPSSGAMGTIVSICGNNLLGGGARVMSVVLNSRMAFNIIESFDTYIRVVAAGSTGPLQPGSVQVISDTMAITESTNSPARFEYLEPGNILSISLSQGQNGTIVTIRGERLHNGEGIAEVLLAGVEAVIRNIQGTMLNSDVVVEAGRPANPGSFQGPVVVLSGRNTTTISSQNFTYLSEGIIFSVRPRQGRNGTVVAIEGENLLGGGMTLQSVMLAGELADIVNQTNGALSTVYVRAPPGFESSVTGDVVLVSDTNAHVRRVDGWTYEQRGLVASVNPNQGQYGTRVTISGQNLLSGGDGIAVLRFDDVRLEVDSANDTTIIARVGQPIDPVAFVSDTISIESTSGGLLYVNYTWSFLNQSSISSIDPSSGFSREIVTINGTNLLGGGNRITSVSTAGIVGREMTSSNDEVVIITGVNDLGSMQQGELVLESDTGARTVGTWTYDEECPINMFGMANSCQPCDEQCARCNGPSEFNCTVCEDFSIYFGENSTGLLCVEKCPNVSTVDNVCVDVCETNQYSQIDSLQNQTFCFNCSSLCDQSLGCSGPEPSQCGGCQFFRDVDNQTCIQNCSRDSNFVDGANNCIPCHPQCVNGCRGPSDFECSSCANLRVNANVVGIDPALLPDNVCREACPDLFFLDPLSNPGFCQPCDSSCSVGCSGPTPFDCGDCRNVSIEGPNRRRMCLNSCSTSHYMNESKFCLPCSDLCLPGIGCTGPSPDECNACSLAHAPNLNCVRECQDSTYFIRNSTRTCEKCADACGSGGCTEAGPQNCIRQDAFSAGSGTTAIVIVIILLLVIVIVVLVTLMIIVLYRRRSGSSAKYNFSPKLLTRKSKKEPVQTTKVESVPLSSIEESKTMANPVFSEGPDANYSEMGVDNYLESGLDALYIDADYEQTALPERNNTVSASQDLYTDMDNLPQSKTMIEEVPASQDVYTDMEQIPILPPKPEKAPPTVPPKDEEPQVVEEANPPSIPEKAQKPPPPPQETGELYTDMQGGITEVFVNPSPDELYVEPDQSATTSPVAKYRPPIEEPDPDATYEDTETALASVDHYRKSFGAGSNNTAALQPREPQKSTLPKRQSAPALPLQPIPTRRPSSSAGTPLPPTPIQKSFSTNNFQPSTSPTSTLTRPGSVISGGGIPEEESLYDDISGVQPLVKPAPPPPKPQPKKREQKQRKK
jgi:hypothetical protein